MTRFEEIEFNIKNVKERVARAALKSGRKPEDITIVAVSKTVDVDDVVAAINCGIQNFGENRVQELMRKYSEFENMKDMDVKPTWHMIGHLQKNKVKYIIDKVTMIHSVDSIELAAEIDKHASRKNIIIPILLQVNVSGEESKFGISPDNAMDFVMKMSNFSNITLEGLMTMAPHVTEPENIRFVFRELRRIYLDIYEREFHNVNMKFLSMGMSNDFEIAVEEGANIIRVGSSVFHER